MSRAKIIAASIMVALASAASLASLYMFHFGMISFWILPVVFAVYGLFWAIKKIAQNSEKGFSRSCPIKLYAVASMIFFPLTALCCSSFMFQLYALLGVTSLVDNIHQLYKRERSKSVLDLIETFMTNPKECAKESSPLKQAFPFQVIATVAFSIFAIVGYFTISPEIFITILAGICISSVVVELIKDIALPNSNLKDTSDENALEQTNKRKSFQAAQDFQ